ncbi:hypothetical protein GXY_15267 [Novacetimonas hansenii ATCC 23769]|uniref:Uncharacterized protein n=1 Tax=Novacetimonas hansenii ATCC 23769 TaxID=714995 RepID=D5QIS2_NOVHA|nr:hypothetical protein GXY_15267 [Novacetimonas hansenii ATCC 23769]
MAGAARHDRIKEVLPKGDTGRAAPGNAKRVFENNSLIKNRKSFWVPPFDRNRRRLLKLFRKSFTKNLYDFRMLLILAFQTVSNIGQR